MNSASNGNTRIVYGRCLNMTSLAYLSYLVLILAVGVFFSMSVKRVTVGFGEKSVCYLTFAPTVGEVLKEVGINNNFGPDRPPGSLSGGESMSYLTVSHTQLEKAADGSKIRVYQNRVSKSVEDIVVVPPVRKEWDIFLSPGQERVIDPGQNGLRKNFFLESFRDGKRVSRQLTESYLAVKPKPVIVASGSYAEVSRQGANYSGKPARFVATAYSHTGYHTAVGADTRRGIVAVDPRVIPLGTRLYIRGYGYGIAADTGGAIKGNRIDLFFESNREAKKWGRRAVDVYILKKSW